jgi:hypothetical protein
VAGLFAELPSRTTTWRRGPGFIFAADLGVYEPNVIGTLNLLELARSQESQVRIASTPA